MSRRGRDVFAATDYALAILAAVVILSLTALSARALYVVAAERRVIDDREVVAAVTTAVYGDLNEINHAVSVVARDWAAPSPSDLSRLGLSDAATVGFVTPSSGAIGRTPVLPPVDPEGLVPALLDRARDSALTVVSAPVNYADGPRTLVVATVYQRDRSSGTPITVVDRRALTIGWVVAAVDLDEVLRLNMPPGVVASLRDGRSSQAAESLARVGLPEQRVVLGGRDFVVTAGNPADVPLPTAAWVALIVGVVLAGAAALGVLVARARLRSLQGANHRRAMQVELIGDVAPLVQQSLELAEVLPAVAIQLTDHFGLAGVALSTGGGATSPVRLFSVGANIDPSTKPVLRPPEVLTAGSSLVLAMQRGGRSVARLELVAGRDLDAPDLQSLRALVELVTAAVVNASLYASQQEALRNLQELDALKTVFLGTASHELRTPATAITGFASLLADNWDRFGEEQRRDFVSRIDANARSLSAVVQDLLDFSLLDGGSVALTVEVIDLPALVTSVVERLAPLFTQHELDLRTEIAPVVDGDVNGLERAVTNLLTNAVKFSPPGTTVTVAVGPDPDGGAQVAISDEGPGIAPAERPRVFTRFYRGSGDEVVQTRGVGIGLSVVAELVARLRGDVALDEAPGGGARFTIRLPASRTTAMDKEIEDATTT